MKNINMLSFVFVARKFYINLHSNNENLNFFHNLAEMFNFAKIRSKIMENIKYNEFTRVLTHF